MRLTFYTADPSDPGAAPPDSGGGGGGGGSGGELSQFCNTSWDADTSHKKYGVLPYWAEACGKGAEPPLPYSGYVGESSSPTSSENKDNPPVLNPSGIDEMTAAVPVPATPVRCTFSPSRQAPCDLRLGVAPYQLSAGRWF